MNMEKAQSANEERGWGDFMNIAVTVLSSGKHHTTTNRFQHRCLDQHGVWVSIYSQASTEYRHQTALPEAGSLG